MKRPDPQTVSLAILTLCAPAALLLFVIDAPWTAAVFAGLVVVFPLALIGLVASRRDRATLAALLLVMGGSMAGLFLLRGRPEASAAALIFGLFLLPLLISTIGYALAFDRHGLSAADLGELRRRFPPPEQGG